MSVFVLIFSLYAQARAKGGADQVLAIVISFCFRPFFFPQTPTNSPPPQNHHRNFYSFNFPASSPEDFICTFTKMHEHLSCLCSEGWQQFYRSQKSPERMGCPEPPLSAKVQGWIYDTHPYLRFCKTLGRILVQPSVRVRWLYFPLRTQVTR